MLTHQTKKEHIDELDDNIDENNDINDDENNDINDDENNDKNNDENGNVIIIKKNIVKFKHVCEYCKMKFSTIGGMRSHVCELKNDILIRLQILEEEFKQLKIEKIKIKKLEADIKKLTDDNKNLRVTRNIVYNNTINNDNRTKI